MIIVSDAASVHLAKMLKDADAPRGAAIRLKTTSSNLSMTLDHPVSSDETFEHDGKIVLLVDPKVSQSLSGKTLEVEQKHEGLRFALQ